MRHGLPLDRRDHAEPPARPSRVCDTWGGGDVGQASPALGQAFLMPMVLAVALVAGPPVVGAATVTIAWQARVGTSGANGTVAVAGDASGAGAATLGLTGLGASTLVPLVISKGTCAVVGSTIVRLPSVRSTSAGAVSGTVSLTDAELGAIRSASVTGTIAVRVGSSSTGGARCGVFTVTTKPLPAAYPGPLGARVLFTYYFYWYDTVTGAHLGAHGPAIDPLTDRPVPDPPATWRGTAWHAKQLMDMAYAGIDVVLPNYWGNAERELWPRRGIVTLAQALDRVRTAGTTPPAVGLFYDTESRRGLDLRTKAGRDAIYDDVRFFFTTIPRRYWALAEGSRPIVWFYGAGPLGGYDSAFLADLATRFARDFGAEPYIVLEVGWPAGVPGLTGQDATYKWIGPQTPVWTDAIASVDPGFDERWIAGRAQPWRVLPREGGAVYRRSLAAATACGVPWLAIETWSGFDEASDIAESVEYGRRYLDITRTYAAWFKAGALPAGVRIETPYADSPSVSTVLGASDVSRGLTLVPSTRDDAGLHVPVVEAGQAGRRTVFLAPDAPEAYLYFRVDDGFYFNRPQDVRIDVTYFDEGTQPIYLDYDAAPCASAWNAETMYKRTTLASASDTKTWKTASIVLRDATFTDHQNQAADFHLVALDGQPLTVGSVAVTKLP